MKPFLKCIIIIFLIQAQVNSYAQNIFPDTGSAGIGTTLPSASALLEMRSTTQGLLVPRLTVAQRNAIVSPATGLLIYQTNSTPAFYYYNGSAWVQIALTTTGANKSLSNLTSPTAVNVSLLPKFNDSMDLGSSILRYRDVNLYNAKFADGSIQSTAFTPYNAGNGIGISGGTITNTAPDVPVVLNAGSGISVTGTYPNFTLSSTVASSQWASSGSNLYFNTGNVGIGTTSPTTKLHVVSATGLTARFDGGNQMYLSFYENNVYRGYIGSYSGNTTDVDFGTGSSNTTGNVNLTIQAVPKITLTAAGDVGIGTTTPATKFHVAGAGKFDGGLESVGVVNITGGSSFLNLYATNSTHNTWSFYNDGFYSYAKVSSAIVGTAIVANFGVPTESVQFTVWGNASATNFYSTSDARLKKDVEGIDKEFSALQIINKLNPVSYHFKSDEYKLLNLPKSKQYGFLAQEIQQVLPDLVQSTKMPVSENAAGGIERKEMLTVNYIGLIPVLTEALKEQQKMIDAKTDELKKQQQVTDDLQKQINDLKAMMLQLQSNGVSNAISQSSVIVTNNESLEQNIPNPFANTTVINYTLPQKFSNAQIIITDKTGKTLKQVNISGSGKGFVTVDASTLTAGAYQYSLLVDGKLIGTKQMIHTK